MKAMTSSFIKWVLFTAVFALEFAPAARGSDTPITITFDNLIPGASGILITNGYGGLQWNNFGVLDGSITQTNYGYYKGIVSSNNVAFNEYGNPASISSTNPFNLNSAYLTSQVLSSLRVEVQGYSGDSLLYDNFYVLNPNGPQLVNFNYTNVTLVKFITPTSSWFAMDNLTVTEPLNPPPVFTPIPGPVTPVAGLNPLEIGTVTVPSIGHLFFSNPPFVSIPATVSDFLIDQRQEVGSGGITPIVTGDFDTNSQFVMTIAAPPGQKFLIRPPTNTLVRFYASLDWQGPNVLANGPSIFGTVAVRFTDLNGLAPDFSPSRTALSTGHEFFGFNDIESTGFSNELSFTSITLTANVPFTITNLGPVVYQPESDNAFVVTYSTTKTNDPGVFVSLVPADLPTNNPSLITFDDLVITDSHALITNGYAGLQWNNFGVINGAIRPPIEGYHAGLISPDNVAFNGSGDPASISSTTPFNLNYAYLTAAFVQGLKVEVQGFAGASLAYDNTYTLNPTNPTFINFNFLGVTSVRFITTPGSQFALDNLSITKNGTLITFDDTNPTYSSDFITNGYSGFQWTNFGVFDGGDRPVTSGYYVGTISPKNIAYTGSGNAASVSSVTPFTLDSAHLTAALEFLPGFNVEVQGFAGTSLLYDNYYAVNSTNAQFVKFNYTGVTQVKFIPPPGFILAMDNLIVTKNVGVPQPPVAPPLPPPLPPVANVGTLEIGTIEVSGAGQIVYDTPAAPGHIPPPNELKDFLIDQSQTSGGGGVLPSVSVNWDSHDAFALTISAPPGQKFLVKVPTGLSASFIGSLLWETTGGGDSPAGPLTITFANLQGASPDFSASSAVLADTAGYFGCYEILSTPFTNGLSFNSMTIKGTVGPDQTGFGLQTYTPTSDSFLAISYPLTGTNSPTPFITIVPATVPPPLLPKNPVKITVQPNGDILVTFTGGTLQSSSGMAGTYTDVSGSSAGSYTIPKGIQSPIQYFRVRSN